MRPVILTAAVTSLIVLASALLAQNGLPPHKPGTICITQSGWCWVAQSAVGSPCGCATSQGYIEGTRG